MFRALSHSLSFLLQPTKFIYTTSIQIKYSELTLSRYDVKIYESKYLAKTLCSVLSHSLSRYGVQIHAEFLNTDNIFGPPLSCFNIKICVPKHLSEKICSLFSLSVFMTNKTNVENLNSENIFGLSLSC